MDTLDFGFAETFVALLNEKFKDTNYVFSVDTGRKFDRIVQSNPLGSGTHVHAFVERATGYVYKSAGWKAPAGGVRYTSVEEAAVAADLHGSYLYAK